ncbi:hypothetical protein FQN53_003000 [Emmonsiellopsis sp. PD_33]|nr:hypothetical protein FQN53_003000 [Emmonsiellopsis sp. PD_33]
MAKKTAQMGTSTEIEGRPPIAAVVGRYGGPDGIVAYIMFLDREGSNAVLWNAPDQSRDGDVKGSPAKLQQGLRNKDCGFAMHEDSRVFQS